MGYLFMRLFAVCFVALLFLPVITMFTGFHHEVKSGEHTGYVTAVQTEGLFFETATAYVKTEISSSQEDRYCVKMTDTELINELKEKAATQEKVTLEYIAYFANGITTCSGEVDIITNIK